MNISVSFLISGFLIALGSCAQQSQKAQAIPTVFAGSTPCDAFIKAQMNIPQDVLCDFIRWELTLDFEGPGLFELKAEYGESKPNTLGFKNGKHWFVKGAYSYTTGTVENPKTRILILQAPELRSAIQLVELDKSILHFADSGRQLLVGNGGWGYVLNKMENPK